MKTGRRDQGCDGFVVIGLSSPATSRGSMSNADSPLNPEHISRLPKEVTQNTRARMHLAAWRCALLRDLPGKLTAHQLAANPAWAGSLPLRRADRSADVHAQGKISAACFFCGKFSRNSVSFNVSEARRVVRDTRREHRRRGDQPPRLRRRKNFILPQEKFRATRCLRFAARLDASVNVRGMRESRL